MCLGLQTTKLNHPLKRRKKYLKSPLAQYHSKNMNHKRTVAVKYISKCEEGVNYKYFHVHYSIGFSYMDVAKFVSWSKKCQSRIINEEIKPQSDLKEKKLRFPHDK